MNQVRQFFSLRHALVLVILALGLSGKQNLFVEASESFGIRLDSPRSTMRTFMSAMQEYREGVESGNRVKQSRIQDAIQTLNLSKIPEFLQETQGRQAAIYLKEVIDREILIDYSKIPSLESVQERGIRRWRLKGTEIVIAQTDVTSGKDSDAPGSVSSAKGVYLFSPSTVMRAAEFYQDIKTLPYQAGSGQGALYQEPWLERLLPDWTEKTVFLIPSWKWFGFFLLIIVGLIIKWIAKKWFHLLKKVTHKTTHRWDDELIEALEPPFGLLVACGFWYFGLFGLQLSGRFEVAVSVLLELVTSYAVIWAFYRMTTVVTVYLKGLTKQTDELIDDDVVPLISRTLRVFVLIFGLLIVLQNLGIEVGSVLAGLGIGGLALALASKDLAANLFGFVTIIFDRPFRVGDWVKVKDIEGTVEEIGFRSMRIRTFYNSLITVPNAIVTTEDVDNMGLRKMRRVSTILGIKYDTPPEKVDLFLKEIRKIIENNEYTDKTNIHVVMNGYGASALEMLVYCFLIVPDWAAEMRERQKMYLEILSLAHSMGVEFAFPTSTIHVESLPEKGHS